MPPEGKLTVGIVDGRTGGSDARDAGRGRRVITGAGEEGRQGVGNLSAGDVAGSHVEHRDRVTDWMARDDGVGAAEIVGDIDVSMSACGVKACWYR